MIKTQVYLTETENTGLKSLVRKTGKKQSAIIRQAIDQLLNTQSTTNWKVALKPLNGLWAKRDDLPNFDTLRKEFNRNS